MATTHPSTSPSEAPDVKSIAELNSKNTDVLKYLDDMPDLTPEEKKNFATEYQKALKELTEKQNDGGKAKIIEGLKDEIKKLRDGIASDKKDENGEKDDLNTDETTDKSKQVLSVEKEVRERLADFKKNIEAKITVPTAIPQGAPDIATVMTASDIHFPEDWKNPPLDAITKNPDNAVNNNFLVKILKMFGFDSWANWIIGRANDPDYGGSEEAKNTFETAISLWNTNQSPSFKRLLNIKHLSKKQLYSIFQQAEGLGLDLSNSRNIEAAFGGKNLGDSKLQKYHRIHAGIGRMVADIGEAGGMGYNPEERLLKLFEYSKDTSLDEEIAADRESQNTMNIVPVIAPLPEANSEPNTPATRPAEVIKQENISELKKAEGYDKALIDSRAELEKAKALPEDTLDAKSKKEAALKEAQTKLDTALSDIKNSVESSNKKLDTILKDAENDNQTARLEREQAEKDLESIKALPETPDKTERLKSATLLVENTRKKETKLQEALTTIKTKKALIKPDMTARDALVAAQEADSALRLGRDSAGIMIAANNSEKDQKETAEAQKKEAEALRREFETLQKEINETIYDKESYEIDSPEDVLALKKKIEIFKTSKDPEKIKDFNITSLEDSLAYAQGKIDLIRVFKKVSDHIITKDKQRIVYENIEDDWKTDETGSWAEVDDNGSRLDIDRTGFGYDDYTMFNSGTDPVVVAVGGLKKARLILITHTDVLKGEKSFTSKKGGKIELAKF